jgi:hypothetical protein
MSARPFLQVVSNGTGAKSAREELTESEASTHAALQGVRRALNFPLEARLRVELGLVAATLENQLYALNSLRMRLGAESVEVGVGDELEVADA